MIYGNSNGASKQITVTATLLDGACANQELSQTINFTAPAACNITEPSCPLTLELSGTGENEDYSAESTITTTQNFETGAIATIKANQSITLTAGFHAKAGSNLLINNEGCSN